MTNDFERMWLERLLAFFVRWIWVSDCREVLMMWIKRLSKRMSKAWHPMGVAMSKMVSIE